MKTVLEISSKNVNLSTNKSTFKKMKVSKSLISLLLATTRFPSIIKQKYFRVTRSFLQMLVGYV